MNLVTIVIKGIHLLINYRTVQKIKGLKKRFYSSWISLEFGECGKNCRFSRFSWLNEPRLMKFGSNVTIGKDVVIELYSTYQNQKFDPIFQMGDNSNFGDGGHITCINKILIGNNVVIGRKVFITDNSHGESDRSVLDYNPFLRSLTSKGPVIIEDCVWIGEMVCIMPGVSIGKGSIIGANSVVTKDIPPYCVAVGNPARVIKDLR
ncbi:putative uncharacterized protein [Bacteroides sp. CAG:702]|nr:putative uncharacterized protein [Bacteroides sp. CAG:702]